MTGIDLSDWINNLETVVSHHSNIFTVDLVVSFSTQILILLYQQIHRWITSILKDKRRIVSGLADPNSAKGGERGYVEA